MVKSLKKRLLIAGGIGFGFHIAYIILTMILVNLGIIFPSWLRSIEKYTLAAPLYLIEGFIRSKGCVTVGCMGLSALLTSLFYAIIAILIYFIYLKIKSKK